MLQASRLITSLSPSGPHLRSVGRGIGLAAIVGVLSGLAAVVFHIMTEVVTHYALELWAGYHAGGPAGEPVLFPTLETPLRPWVLLILPALGGLASGLIVMLAAPEAEGAGTNKTIDAYHNRRGVIRGRVPLVKMIVSAITLGTGGSGGREGPIAHIGAGIGSLLATRLGLSDAERRILMSAGLGAGIGALFHAPLAGAMFAVEVLYRGPDFESDALIPSFIATTLAYCVYNVAAAVGGAYLGGFDGFVPLLRVAEAIHFRDPLLLIPLTALTIATVFVSLIYVRSLEYSRTLFGRLPLPLPLRPTLGGLIVGAIAVGIYYTLIAVYDSAAAHRGLSVLSLGYGYLQRLLLADEGVTLLMIALPVVALGKIVTTSVTIGSGGSGGVFGPSMVIGGAVGALVGLGARHFMPEVVTRIDVFVILGMAGLFAAAAKTPVSTLLMVTEVTASYELLLPAMWVCALAYLLSRGWTLFPAQVPSRKDSPAHRGEFVIDILQGLCVRDILDSAARHVVTVPADMPLAQVVKLITTTKQTTFPIIDADGRYAGVFGINDVRQFLYDTHAADVVLAHDLAAKVEPLTNETTLGSAIELFVAHSHEELPVVDTQQPTQPVIALLRRQDVIAAYNNRLLQMRSEDLTGAAPPPPSSRSAKP